MATLEELRGGNKFAFELIYREYSPRLYNFIRSIVRSKSDAQDILQVTFLKVWEKREELDFTKNFEAYIYTIARNLCLTYLRQRLYAQLVPLDGHDKPDDEVLHRIIDVDSAKYIYKIIDMLPERRKEIFLLSRMSSMTYLQIAEHLDISENTVKIQVKRALAFLREELSKEQFYFLCFLIYLT